MKISKEKAFELIDGKVEQFKRVLENSKYSNRYGDEYQLAYHGTEELLNQLFSEEESKKFRKSVITSGFNVKPSEQLEGYRKHIRSCIAILKVYRERIETFWDGNNDKLSSDKEKKIVDGTNLTNTELENEIVKYLSNVIRSKDFNLINLSFDNLAKHLSLNEKSKSKRLKNIIYNILNRKIVSINSGVDLFIPVELYRHPNIKKIKPVNPFLNFLYSYITGFVLLIILFTAIPILSNFISELYKTIPSTTGLFAYAAALGLFLPMSIGWICIKTYRYIIKIIPQINSKALFTIIASEFVALLIYLFIIFILEEGLSSTGIIGALAFGLALAGVIWKLVIKPKKEITELKSDEG